jgi:hypothetical protein
MKKIRKVVFPVACLGTRFPLPMRYRIQISRLHSASNSDV